jgi:hypothetical protein
VGKFGHLTSNPILGHSTAAFVGRNDAAINLVLDLFRKKDAIKIALLGSGIFEPLTIAASRRLPKKSLVAAYDNSPKVISMLRDLLRTGLPLPDSIIRKSESWKLNFTKQLISRLNYLERIGTDTSLLLSSRDRISSECRLNSILQVHEFDITDLPRQWLAEQKQWDIIACINVLPNLSISLGPGIIPSWLQNLADFLKPGGLAIIGSLDSHFYQSSYHPEKSTHFSGELFSSIQCAPLKLIGWVDRTYVKEIFEGKELMDGYIYLFLGKDSCDFRESLSQVHTLIPDQIPASLITEEIHLEDDALRISRISHVLAAFRSRQVFRMVRTRLAFPQSLELFFTDTNKGELSLGICERLLLPINAY